MRRPTAIALLAPLLLLPAAGCSNVERMLNSLGGVTSSLADRVSSVHENDDAFAIELTGPIGVDVESFGGDVRIYVDPELTEAIVTVTRRAVHGYGRRDESKTALENIGYSVEIVGGELGQVLQVRTSTDDIEPYFCRADIRIDLPEVDGLRVKTTNGNVIARDVAGKIDIETDDGTALVMTNYALTEPIQILNHSGNVDLRMRGESRGSFDCYAYRGRVIHHSHYGKWIVHNGTSFDRLYATFNEGENQILLRAADGEIRIAVVPAPTLVGTFILD